MAVGLLSTYAASITTKVPLVGWFMILYATFNNISVISWWSVSVEEKTTDLSQVTLTLRQHVVSSTPQHERDSNSQRWWRYALTFVSPINKNNPHDTNIVFVLWNIFVTNDHGYVPLVVNTSRSFPPSWLITGFVTRLIRWVPLVEQKLFTLP
jgi:hypothetical protein